jgi:heptosyltransferase-2
MTVPALRELRRVLPSARITLATRSWSRGIFADADFVDQVLVHDPTGHTVSDFRRQVSEWRRAGFDLAVLFQNSFQAALTAFSAGIPSRIGYSTQHRGPLLSSAIPLPPWRRERHEVFYYLNIIQHLENTLIGRSEVLEHSPRFEVSVSSESSQRGRAILSTAGLSVGSLVVALCPGSTNSRAKRWPAERFAQLADLLVQQLGARVVLMGAPDELEISQKVAQMMQSAPVMLTGETSLDDAVAVLSLVDVLISNDTGPAHISAALGTPTVVIFGPTDPVTTRPFPEAAVVVRRPPDCAPCMLRDCPIDHRCMTAITSEMVFEQVLTIMKSTKLHSIPEVRG